jgi:hypothetical protein
MSEMSSSSPPGADTAAPAIAAPPLVPAGAPLCFVVDEEPSIRHFLSLILHGLGIDTLEFAEGAGAAPARPRVPQHRDRVHRRQRIDGRAR